MDRYLLLAAPAAAASVAVAGPLPDIQWQDNNNIVAFVPESPSAFNQDARGQTYPVLETQWLRSPSDFLEESGQAHYNKDLIASIPQADSSTIIVHKSQGDSIPGSKEGGHGEAVGEGEQP